MHRTQIQLEEWQYELLVGEAESRGTSLADVVRTAVSEYFERRRPASGSGLSKIAGIAEDPGIAGRDHDRVLYGPGSPSGEAEASGSRSG